MHRGFHRTNKVPECGVSAWTPSKHQRVVVRNEEREGFPSQAKRFPPQPRLDGHPGPGSYGDASSWGVASPSFSVKGTTGFVPPKAARPTGLPRGGIPGPGAYTLRRSLLREHDFNAGVSRVFRSPLAAQPGAPKQQTPAPNQYDVRCRSSDRNFSTGTSSFLSKTGRDSFCPNKDVPSPWHYDMSGVLFQHGPAVLSPFKSKTQRIPSALDNHVPGPGAYSPHEAPVRRTILPCASRGGHYFAVSAPPLSLPKDPPLPGPGQYDLGVHDGRPRKPKPTAAFASRTKRVLQNSMAEMRPDPGPGFYDPQIMTKRSFLYNDSGIWVPV